MQKPLALSALSVLLVMSVTALAATAARGAGSVQLVGTLATTNYSVVVTRTCPKALLTCTNVKAKIKTKDGREYQLSRGTSFVANATPSNALSPATGYRFTHKKTEYVVLESGDLTITRRGITIAKEQGSWSRQGSTS